MTRKIVTLVSLIALLFSANKVKAQNEDNYYRESKTIYQGEGYWLNNYIYLVSEEKAKEIHNVIDATENQGAVIKKIHEELDNLYSETNRSKKDTIFIQADSINFIKNISQKKKKIYDERIINIYKKNHHHELSNTTTLNFKKSTFTDVVTGINNAMDWEEETEVKKKNSNRKIAKFNLVLGSGVLNWGNKGFFTPLSANDPYSVKWSYQSDLLVKCTLFPESRISFTTGIGLQTDYFFFENGFDSYEFETSPLTDNYTIKQNILIHNCITIPLLIDIKLFDDIKLHFGLMGGIAISNLTGGFVRSFEENGVTTNQYSGSAFNQFNELKADLMFGIEIYNITLYVNHAMVDLFDNSYPFSARPFAFGVMFGL